MIVGIDPGQSGAFVFMWEYSGTTPEFESVGMPLNEDKSVHFESVLDILGKRPNARVFLERAHPGGMGVTAAFNYGRGFAALEIAVRLLKLPVTYVEPAKWTKELHEGTPAEWKPKLRSVEAVKRLFPGLLDRIPKGPKSGKFHEGVIDALLIAEYGRRRLSKNA